MTLLESTPDVIRVLTENRVIAVVGFHPDPMKPAHYVPEYMYRQGYTVIPVNPALAVTTPALRSSLFSCAMRL